VLLAAAPLVGLIRQELGGAAAKAQLIELLNDELGVGTAMAGTLLVPYGLRLASDHFSRTTTLRWQ